MATKTFNLTWMGQYRNGTYYAGNSPIRVGGSYNYHSFCGFPPEVRTALRTSKTTPKLKFRMYVTNATIEWDFGGHKETYNKASGSMPWYTYLGNFQTGYQGTGWLTFDLTNLGNFMNRYMNGEFHGVVLYSGTSTNHYGEASNNGSTRVQIIVEGTWNTAPKAPTLQAPLGGEVVDESVTVKWVSNGDPDGDTLKFQVAFQGGDGGAWQYFMTGNNATQYTINTANAVEGSRARVAVRAYDGELYSPFVYSNYFTINHNQKPAKPTQLSPANGDIVDRTKVITFKWRHNDDGVQAGFRLVWRQVYSDGSVGSWNYIPSLSDFMNTTNQFYNMPANTLPDSVIEWTVQTKDQQGEESEYANYVRFEAREPSNAPVILAPTHMGTISTTRVTVEWSSLNQAEYEIELYDTDGLLLYHEHKVSAVKIVTIPVDLVNGQWYEIALRIKDTNGLWTDYSWITFGTQFTPPIKPVIKRAETAGMGVIELFYSSADGNVLPDLLIGEDEVNPLLEGYNSSVDEHEILDKQSFKLIAGTYGTPRGIQMWLTEEQIPLVEGATYELFGTAEAQGTRWLLGAYDENDNLLAVNATPSDLISSPVGNVSLPLVLPAGTTKLLVRFHDTWDNEATEVIFSNVGLKIEGDTPTDRLELFRREYTPTGTATWIKIANDLPLVGTFIDYTPASGVEYEYRLKAVNDSSSTSIDSDITLLRVTFTETFLQEADNLSSIVVLPSVTSRDVNYQIDSALQQFAGRPQPVREFGEYEYVTISLEWEVDTHVEVTMFQEMFRKRGTLLYRDGKGRRYWVTADQVNVKDKEVNGFILSTQLIQTSYAEDLDKQLENYGEELI